MMVLPLNRHCSLEKRALAQAQRYHGTLTPAQKQMFKKRIAKIARKPKLEAVK